MRAFQVHINGKKVCVAGIGQDGVLTSIVNWVAKKGEGDLFVTVGGLISPAGDHVTWVRQDLQVGDEILLRVVEAKTSDVPGKRTSTNLAEEVKNQKKYVRLMAKKLGWTILTKARKRR